MINPSTSFCSGWAPRIDHSFSFVPRRRGRLRLGGERGGLLPDFLAPASQLIVARSRGCPNRIMSGNATYKWCSIAISVKESKFKATFDKQTQSLNVERTKSCTSPRFANPCNTRDVARDRRPPAEGRMGVRTRARTGCPKEARNNDENSKEDSPTDRPISRSVGMEKEPLNDLGERGGKRGEKHFLRHEQA